MQGELERVGDAWRVRFTRRLGHDPAKVWRAITDPEHLRAWFPQEVVVTEWAVGAPLRFVSGMVDDFDGEVLAYEPPSAVEFRWGTDVIRLEVAPAPDGCTLTLLDTIAEVGKAARDGAGWHVCLDALEHSLAGTTPPWTTDDRWRAVHPGYVERWGPEAASIGPPAGWGEAAAAGGGEPS